MIVGEQSFGDHLHHHIDHRTLMFRFTATRQQHSHCASTASSIWKRMCLLKRDPTPKKKSTVRTCRLLRWTVHECELCKGAYIRHSQYSCAQSQCVRCSASNPKNGQPEISCTLTLVPLQVYMEYVFVAP
jgi:hypothetical protein